MVRSSSSHQYLDLPIPNFLKLNRTIRIILGRKGQMYLATSERSGSGPGSSIKINRRRYNLEGPFDLRLLQKKYSMQPEVIDFRSEILHDNLSVDVVDIDNAKNVIDSNKIIRYIYESFENIDPYIGDLVISENGSIDLNESSRPQRASRIEVSLPKKQIKKKPIKHTSSSEDVSDILKHFSFEQILNGAITGKTLVEPGADSLQQVEQNMEVPHLEEFLEGAGKGRDINEIGRYEDAFAVSLDDIVSRPIEENLLEKNILIIGKNVLYLGPPSGYDSAYTIRAGGMELVVSSSTNLTDFQDKYKRDFAEVVKRTVGDSSAILENLGLATKDILMLNLADKKSGKLMENFGFKKLSSSSYWVYVNVQKHIVYNRSERTYWFHPDSEDNIGVEVYLDFKGEVRKGFPGNKKNSKYGHSFLGTRYSDSKRSMPFCIIEFNKLWEENSEMYQKISLWEILSKAQLTILHGYQGHQQVRAIEDAAKKISSAEAKKLRDEENVIQINVEGDSDGVLNMQGVKQNV